MMMLKRLLAFPAAIVLLAGTGATAAADHGVLRLAVPRFHLNATQSNNWFGYDRGALNRHGSPFTSISAVWTVPAASRHNGQAGKSATWVGIGGGCTNPDCSISDPSSLIQAGTGQDVSRSGKASYYAWWEIIPQPSTTISGFTVRPGDRVSVSIRETTLGHWQIIVRDRSRDEKFTQSVAYPDAGVSAEWIEEIPLVVGGGGAGTANLPSLAETPFDNATLNGSNPHLKSSERIVLVDGTGTKVIGRPSAPDATGDGFGACTWAARCPVPRS